MKTMIKGSKIRNIGLLILALIALGLLYRYSPYKVEYLGHYDKIWAHRVDSKEKLKSALNYFKGVELDLVYDEDKDYMDVGHPPVKPINLSLRQYLSEIPEDSKPYLWLDLKNLKLENANIILKKLITIFSERDYPFDKILVESRNPETLPAFSDAGFRTSFYLLPGISKIEKSKREDEIKAIKTVLSKQPNLAISSNYEDYELMKTYFPTTKKYLWIINSVTKHGFSEPRKILKDSTVKAVLISYRSFNGNR